MVACKKIEVDFTYSPAEPRAGQAVTFSNLSTGGEEWSWTFGDGGTSTSKSPTYTYKNPGTYDVTLKVDGKKSLVRVQQITVYDTVPSFSASDTVFTIFRDYTFKALVYNPYGYTVSYDWMLPMDATYAEVTSASMSEASLSLYFTEAMAEAPLYLRVVMNGDTTLVAQTFCVSDRTTNSVLYRNAQGDYRQRIFGQRAEGVQVDATAKTLLDAEQDTIQTYNGHTFQLSELQAIFPELLGFKIANRKVYYRATDGLWVASLDGSNPVQIEQEACSAMTIDLVDNRIYWAVADQVKYMPLVGSDNNRFVTVPQTINTLIGVTRIAADN